MKLGFPKARMRNVAGATMGADLAAREWAGQRAVYESSQQMFSSIADTLSKREKRKSMLQYQDTVSQASRLLDSGDELTLADIEDIIDPSLLDEETRNYALANEGRVPTWKVQGQILSAVMEQAAEKATQGISIPAERDAFNDQLREQNIRVLEASMADAATKKEAWLSKDAMQTILGISNPSIRLNQIEDDKEYLTPQQYDSLKAAATEEQFQIAANDAIRSGDLEAIEEFSSWMLSDEARETGLLDEQSRYRLANRLDTAARGIKSEAATKKLNEANLATIGFGYAKNAADNMIRDGGAVADSYSTARPNDLDVVASNLALMRQQYLKLYNADPDNTSLVTRDEEIKKMEAELELVENKLWFNAIGVPSSQAALDTMLEGELKTKLTEHLAGMRQAASSKGVDMALDSGQIASVDELQNPAVYEKLQDFYGVVAFPMRSQSTVDSLVAEYTNPNATNTTKLQIAGALAEDPMFANQVGDVIGDKNVTELLALGLSPDGGIAGQIQTGLSRTDWSIDSAGYDEIDTLLQETYGTLYRAYPNRFAIMRKQVEGLAMYQGSTENLDDLLERVGPAVVNVNGYDTLVDGKLDADYLPRYVETLMPDDLKTVPFGMTASQTLEHLRSGKELIATAGGYYVRQPNTLQYFKNADGSKWVLPYTERESATGSMMYSGKDTSTRRGSGARVTGSRN